MKLTRLFTALLSGGLKGHFGQYAEDVAVRKYFPHNTSSGRYLDLGAYHPFEHSNTAFFWLRGWSGINVDANPRTIELFNRVRKNDVNIWSAVVPQSMISQGLTEVTLELPGQTDGAVNVQQTGRISWSSGSVNNLKHVTVPVISVGQILTQHSVRDLDFLNIDVEGFDEQIIEDFDFDFCSPKMICVEDFSESFEELIKSKMSRILQGANYKLIARVGYSSVFSLGGKSY